MSDKTVFQKIIDKEIPADIVYEDGEVLAFKDISPKAPVHILVIPKKPIPTVMDMEEEDVQLMGKLIYRAKCIAQQNGLKGYKLLFNCGREGGQVVFHVHLHLLGGLEMDLCEA